MADGKVARLVGEGMERPNADRELPLDINYAKLSEWLVGARTAAWSAELDLLGFMQQSSPCQ